MRAPSKNAKHDSTAHPVEDRLLSLSFYGVIVFIVALIVATLPRVPFDGCGSVSLSYPF